MEKCLHQLHIRNAVEVAACIRAAYCRTAIWYALLQ